jgi:dipeptidyl aminopeptidase/acylaminoacyl peptidase
MAMITHDAHPFGGLTRRRWMGLGLAGLGAWAVGTSRAFDAPPGRIYVMAMTGAKDAKGNDVDSLLAIDPEKGNWTSILDDCTMRPRVSPDGRRVAFSREGSVWVGGLAGGAEPARVLDLEGTTAGSPAVWSADGRQIIVSLGTHPEGAGSWVFRTVRIHADGSEKVELPIPAEDGVVDWSSDGRWLLTVSSRNAQIGWQLYVMRDDGTEVRQITEGGNPFYARFSPDGRQVAYADGTSEERRGIWIVNADGTDRRKIVATGKAASSPCWSPDGQRLAVGRYHFTDRPFAAQVEVYDLGGVRHLVVDLPERSRPDMPDWR